MKRIPNLLTIFRGVATLAIIALFFSAVPDRYVYVYILFILAALSDFFDGALARRWGIVTDFGIVFDPLFDKILVLTLIVLVYPLGIVSPLILLILFLRDISTDALKNYLMSKGVMTPAVITAKYKTALQLLMLNFILLSLAWSQIPYMALLAEISGWAAVIFSLHSGGVYLNKFIAFTRGETTSSSQ